MVEIGTNRRDTRFAARQRELRRRRERFAPKAGQLTLRQISSLLAACQRDLAAGIDPERVSQALSFVIFLLAPYAADEQDFLERIAAGEAD